MLSLNIGLGIIGPAVIMALGDAPVWAWLAVYGAELAGLGLGCVLVRIADR